jgi:hypothetical protein
MKCSSLTLAVVSGLGFALGYAPSHDSAQAATRTRLEREIPALDSHSTELQDLLAADDAAQLAPTRRLNRSPAVLDLPTDRPSGENANAVLEHEHRVANEIYPATED